MLNRIRLDDRFSNYLPCRNYEVLKTRMIHRGREFIGILLLICLFGSTLLLVLQNDDVFMNKYQIATIQYLILWLSSLLGGLLMDIISFPPMVGMLLSGILLGNISNRRIAISDHGGEIIRTSSLSIILLISGMEIDIESIKKSGAIAMKLTCIPGIVEATTCGILSTFMFNMPFSLGMSQGFIIAAVSPAILVVGMLNLKKKGYGVKKGIPSLIIAAASFDDVVAISGFSFFIEMSIVKENESIVYSILYGPLSIVIGILLGLIGAAVLSL